MTLDNGPFHIFLVTDQHMQVITFFTFPIFHLKYLEIYETFPDLVLPNTGGFCVPVSPWGVATPYSSRLIPWDIQFGGRRSSRA